ncbi:hypothetical protein [Agrobacterium tumefaciens]|uniref:hypothetical protein n=1 Tax=Agrobacterium tumefaciens TaxID=358 RepID=UPI001F2629F0
MNEGGETFDDEDNSYCERDLKNDVEALFQINAIDDIPHNPSAERCRSGNKQHRDHCRRIPANVLSEVLFEKPSKKFFVVRRQK